MYDWKYIYIEKKRPNPKSTCHSLLKIKAFQFQMGLDIFMGLCFSAVSSEKGP
jgi:hypothetical protein